MRHPSTLILFTQSYPYDIAYEQTFLEPELTILSMNFERVIVVPQRVGGDRVVVPEGAEVEETYAFMGRSLLNTFQSVLRILISAFFYEELFNHFRTLLHPNALLSLVLHASRAELTRKWIRHFIKLQNIDPAKCIFYTYWLDYSCSGIGLLKKCYPQIRLVSRAHSADLYEERYKPAYIPCRKRTLKGLDFLFPDSQKGAEYIKERYPWFADNCEFSGQGVVEPGFVTSPSADGVFRIVSCSFIIPRKRIDLLLKGIAHAAKTRPQQRFEWNHIGAGPLKSHVMELARELMPSNAKMRILGYLPPTRMMAFYKDNPIDVFINVSDNEGTPVSLMEAASCGMPIIATAVGGNTEIVSEDNGLLVGANPSVEDVAQAILIILDHPLEAIKKRKMSLNVWGAKYNASANFQTFADRLKTIRGSGFTR